MRAAVYEAYGPPEVLRISDVAAPEPGHGEVRVRVHASTVNRLDCHTREANRSNGAAVSLLSRAVSGFRRPRRPILGTEFAGVIDRLGSGVTRFKLGDRVFGNTGLRFACHAEYVCVRETMRMTSMPANVAFDAAAAATDGAFNALWCLGQAHIRKGRPVLVYGASGAIGTAGVQLAARHFRAEVTAVCSTKHLDLMRTLGATHVIDYTREDFTENGRTYDVIFDAVGKHAYQRCKGSLNDGGYFLATDGFRNLMLTLWTGRIGKGRKVRFTLPPKYSQADLELIKRLMDEGRFQPVIDRRYALDDVIEAARYVETQQKTGNVVLTIAAAAT